MSNSSKLCQSVEYLTRQHLHKDYGKQPSPRSLSSAWQIIKAVVSEHHEAEADAMTATRAEVLNQAMVMAGCFTTQCLPLLPQRFDLINSRGAALFCPIQFCSNDGAVDKCTCSTP